MQRVPRLLLLLAILALLAWWSRSPHKGSGPGTTPPRPATQPVTETDARQFVALENSESSLDQTTWRMAHAAFQCEDVLLARWSALNAGRNLAEVFADWPWVAGPWKTKHSLILGEIDAWSVTRDAVSGPVQSAGPWLAQWHKDGWRLVGSHWRQVGWSPGPPARSEFEARLMLRQLRVDAGSQEDPAQPAAGVRADARIRLSVEWLPLADARAEPVPARVELRRAEIHRQSTAPWFREVWSTDLVPRRKTEFTDPLLAADWDGDGLTDLILPGAGQVMRNGTRQGGPWFTAQPLADLPAENLFAGAVADWDRDGWNDLLLLGDHGLWLGKGGAAGIKDSSASLIWSAPDRLRHPQVLALGDIDADGDLDAFAGQYKLPYQMGQFPTPYHDANDGFPSYLLRHDQEGLTDVTETAGLASKRRRRVYSASFVGFTGDGRQDLVVVSDFAGVDLWQNDGKGHFADVTAGLGDARHLFGMAHVVGDFDRNGAADVLVIGMDSPTASVLDGLGLGRAEFPDHTRLRAPMTAGNRVLLGDGRGHWTVAPWNESVAHAGWAWGAVAIDIRNEGRDSFYIVNGHETFENPGDYEREFWLHDIYVGASSNSPVTEMFYRSEAGRRRAAGRSYGGWQDNVLFVDSGDHRHVDLAFLAGVAARADCRNLVCDDFDGDGLMDLALTTFEHWPKRRQRLIVYRNESGGNGHWIGFRLVPTAGGSPIPGASVAVETARGRQRRWMMTGDSFRSQNPAAALFGLGGATNLTRAELIFGSGRRVDLGRLEIDRWHVIRMPVP